MKVKSNQKSAYEKKIKHLVSSYPKIKDDGKIFLNIRDSEGI